MSSNPYAPPKAHVEDIEQSPEPGKAAPPLWNPNAAGLWSLLFSPVFGAFLHMKNWQALGRPDKAEASRMWVIGCAIAIFLLGAGSMFLPESKTIDGISRSAGVGLVIAWFLASGREQVQFVKGRFGDAYPRRRWGKALGCGLLVLFGYFAVVVAIALVAQG